MAYAEIDSGLYSLLSNAGTVTTIVDNKIYQLQAPQGTALPYIVFYQGSNLYTNDTPIENQETVWRVDCWGASLQSAKELAQAVKETLHFKQITLTGFNNYWMAINSETNLLEQNEGKQYFRIIFDVEIYISLEG